MAGRGANLWSSGNDFGRFGAGSRSAATAQQMLSMRSLLCKSSGNHYILYFIVEKVSEEFPFRGNGCGEFAAALSGAESGVLPRDSGTAQALSETMPGMIPGQDAGMVQSLWRGVEGVDKAGFALGLGLRLLSAVDDLAQL